MPVVLPPLSDSEAPELVGPVEVVVVEVVVVELVVVELVVPAVPSVSVSVPPEVASAGLSSSPRQEATQIRSPSEPSRPRAVRTSGD
jgi:hypothetical protein